QDRIDVGAVVEFSRTVLAECKGQKTRGLGIGHAATDALRNGGVERAIGKVAKLTRDAQEGKGAGKVTDGECERQRLFFPPQGAARVRSAIAGRAGPGESACFIPGGEEFRQFRQAIERACKKG